MWRLRSGPGQNQQTDDGRQDDRDHLQVITGLVGVEENGLHHNQHRNSGENDSKQCQTQELHASTCTAYGTACVRVCSSMLSLGARCAALRRGGQLLDVELRREEGEGALEVAALDEQEVGVERRDVHQRDGGERPADGRQDADGVGARRARDAQRAPAAALLERRAQDPELRTRQLPLGKAQLLERRIVGERVAHVAREGRRRLYTFSLLLQWLAIRSQACKSVKAEIRDLFLSFCPK